MAIVKNGEKMFAGATLREEEHMWADGMLEVNTVVWDMEKHEEQWIQTGYYGADGCNLCGSSEVTFEVSKEVARDIIRTRKAEAVEEFCKSVVAKKAAIEKGILAKVVKGKKVPKGTVLNVFWVGERPTYRSRMYDWMNETELIAGCFDEHGDKVWIKAEYLKNITPLKSPNAAERAKFIKAYVDRRVPASIRRVAIG